jgi:hypothetical protein
MSPDFAGGGTPPVLFGLAGADGVWGHRRFALFWTGDTLSALGGALSVAAVPILAYSVNPGDQGSNEMSGKQGDGPSSRWLSRLRRYLPKNASM